MNDPMAIRFHNILNDFIIPFSSSVVAANEKMEVFQIIGTIKYSFFSVLSSAYCFYLNILI